MQDEDSTIARRFIVVRNPEEARRDKAKRDDIVAEAQRRLEEIRQLEGEPHALAACKLRSHKVFGRYIRQSKTGKLSLDRAQIREDEKLDGKYLISTSDEKMAAEDVVAGYKQLADIERVFRDLKHVVDIIPVYHRLPDRIRAHVVLCWMSMLLIRVSENKTAETWHRLKKLFSSIFVGMH